MSRCLAFLLFGLILLVSGTAEGADPRRFCSGTAANVVLYVDVTSPYDERDRQTLMDGVSTIVAGFTGGERLSVRTIADEFARSDRLLDLCMPYCPSNGFFADLVSDCTEGIVINESKRMRAAIAAGINRAMSAARDLPHSEIVRTIAMSASEEYRDGRANRIYIFSDMIENSEFMPGRAFLTTKNEKLIDGLADDKLMPQSRSGRHPDLRRRPRRRSGRTQEPRPGEARQGDGLLAALLQGLRRDADNAAEPFGRLNGNDPRYRSGKKRRCR